MGLSAFTKTALENSGIILKKYIAKPGSEIIVDYTKIMSKNTNMDFIFNRKLLGETLYQARLGTTAYQIGEKLKNGLGETTAQVENIFKKTPGLLNIENRAKSAPSIITKLQRGIDEGKIVSFDTAVQYIADGEGHRIITDALPKFSTKELKQMIKDFKLDDREITSKERRLLAKYVFDHPMSPQERDIAFPLFEKFAIPLIEKRSQPRVDEYMLSIAKYRINNGEISFESIKSERLLPENLIKRLETDSSIESLEMNLLDNYRGKYGLPEFSNRQIQSIRKIAGDDVTIHSRPDLLSYNRHPGFNYTKAEKKEYAIKDSGYRTAQSKVRYANGEYGEIQTKGVYTRKIGEYEHFGHDFRMGKNTSNPIFYRYKREISKLPDWKYSKYNNYIESNYNYYNRLELGLPAHKPKLPKGFTSELSEENMKRMYEQLETESTRLMEGFTPHFSEIAVA